MAVTTYRMSQIGDAIPTHHLVECPRTGAQTLVPGAEVFEALWEVIGELQIPEATSGAQPDEYDRLLVIDQPCHGFPGPYHWSLVTPELVRRVRRVPLAPVREAVANGATEAEIETLIESLAVEVEPAWVQTLPMAA